MGLILVSPKRIIIKKSIRLDFSTTNNEVEYEALQAGLIAIQKLEGKVVKVYCDSRLIAG